MMTLTLPSVPFTIIITHFAWCHDRERQPSIITLLTLVTAINSGGHPTLAASTDPYTAPLEEKQPTRNRSLNAVTSLLVRNHKTIATVVNMPHQILALQQPESMEISEREDESAMDTTNLPVQAIPPSHQDEMNNYINFVDKGTSHIGERFGDWDKLLDIP
jgi:hypothetical protein